MPLYETPANPMPEGAVTGEIVTDDGIRLRFARWMPHKGLRGTVALFQGRADFIEKYYETIQDLRARGFAVATLDWRGQGGSQRLLRNPLKGHIRNFDAYQKDLQAFTRHVLLPDCPAPHYALCHSMGGLILLKSVVEGQRWFDRMVLETPMLGLKVVPMQGLVRPLATALVWSGFARALPPGAQARPSTEIPFAQNFNTSDPVRYARQAEMVRLHPALALGPPTIGWVHAAFSAMEEMADPDVIARIRQPLLIIAGGADRLVSNMAIEHLSARLVAGGHVVVPAARHELLSERDMLRAQFWAAFDAFIPGTPCF
ncbi:alpha/beta fold hydrolase [Xanthobacter sp. TB0139]|uniref:alpha/beta fold hydrolase n=1 Tax=Xanthobacter sp. TB0139 TaxID=3459178 RepID=UPI00403A6CB0